MSWESVKNSYHGVSPITGKIENQIFINKIYANVDGVSETVCIPESAI